MITFYVVLLNMFIAQPDKLEMWDSPSATTPMPFSMHSKNFFPLAFDIVCYFYFMCKNSLNWGSLLSELTKLTDVENDVRKSQSITILRIFNDGMENFKPKHEH